MSCWNCGGSGEVVICPDDLCHGADHCIHGDGMAVCPECSGVPDDEFFESDEERDDAEESPKSMEVDLQRELDADFAERKTKAGELPRLNPDATWWATGGSLDIRTDVQRKILPIVLPKVVKR